MAVDIAPQTVSLAVLPFDGYAGNHEMAHFALGFVEDLVVDLSRFSGLDIIAPYTAQQLGRGDKDILEAAREISIEYLLRPSLRFTQDNLRINIQLLTTSNGVVLWAERYDAPLTHFFDILDQTVQQVVFAIQKEVEHDLLRLARGKTTQKLDVYDCWLRGMSRLSHGTLESDKEARTFFQRALEMDSNYSRAFAGLSLSHFNEWSCQLWELYEESEQNAFTYATKALQLDDTDHVVHMILGRVYIYRHQWDEAERHIMKSLELNPSDADNLIQLASCMTFLGKVAEGERLVTKALRLNPYRNLWYHQYGSFVYFVKKEYDTSIKMALKRQLTNTWVDLPGYICAAHAHLGRLAEAKPYLDMFIETFQRAILKGEPPTSEKILTWVQQANPFKHRTDADNIIHGLCLAGLEEATTSPPPPEQRDPAPSPSHAIFKKEHATWRLSYKGVEITLTNMKGVEDISRLLRQPEHQIHCTDLMGGESSMDEQSYVIDNKAREAYKQHLGDLEEEMQEAQEHNDEGRLRLLREEYEQITDHLSKALGLGKRTRKLGSTTERSRAAVTLRIRNAIKRITTHHPSLGKHLSNAVQTGVYCCYSPETELDWILD